MNYIDPNKVEKIIEELEYWKNKKASDSMHPSRKWDDIRLSQGYIQGLEASIELIKITFPLIFKKDKENEEEFF